MKCVAKRLPWKTNIYIFLQDSYNILHRKGLWFYTEKKIKLKKWKWIIKKSRKIKTVTRKIKRKKTNEEQFLIINDNKLLLSNRFSSNISLLVKSSFLDILISLSIWEFYCWHFILLVNVLLVCCVVALFNMQLYQIICAQKHGWQNISTYKIKQKTVSIGVTFN